MKQSVRIHFLLFSFFLLSSSLWGQNNIGDCSGALIICDKSPLTVNTLLGSGDLSESSLGSCFPNTFQETNSVWLKWKIESGGSLAFTIIPLNKADDIDFALFRVKNLESCYLDEPLRCMAAGPNLGDEKEAIQTCTGATGLQARIVANSKPCGCMQEEENFLSSVETKSGEYYALFINNFRSMGGVTIEWSGTTSFEAIQETCLDATYLSRTDTILPNNRVLFSEAFPNPTTNRVSITAFSSQEQEGDLQVIGSDGLLEYRKSFLLLPGDNIIEMPSENLRIGTHFIRVQTHEVNQVLRFVKQ